MALSILDGTQTATTLSTILSSGQHITAHTVVSLGTQAITDMRSAVSGSVVSISNFPATQPVSIASVTIGSLPAISGAITVVSLGTQAITDVRNAVTGAMIASTISLRAGVSQIGSVTCSAFDAQFTDSQAGGIVRTALHYKDSEWYPVSVDDGLPVSVANLVSLNPIPAGTNRIGVVTIGGGTVTIGAGTAQIGSVTASISSFATSVTVANHQGTAVTTSNFTSTTASTVLANYNATREVLTIFNEGAGNLHICAGATCTTIAYQVRLSSGDYYEAPLNQTSLTHSAVFATAGTARIVQIS